MWLPALVVSALIGFNKFIQASHFKKIISWLGLPANITLFIFGLPVVIFLFFSFGPFVGQPIHKHLPADEVWLNQKFDGIPQNGYLATTPDLLANISSRPNIYNLFYHLSGHFQYSDKKYELPAEVSDLVINTRYFLDENNSSSKEEYYNVDNKLRNLINDRGFVLLSASGGLQYWHRQSSGGLKLIEIIDSSIVESDYLSPLGMSPEMILLKTKVSKMVDDLWLVETWWKTNKSLSDNWKVAVSWIDGNNIILHQEIYPLGWGIYPTSEWKTDEVVKINFWLSDIKDLNHYNFKLLNSSTSFLINRWGGWSDMTKPVYSSNAVNITLPN